MKTIAFFNNKGGVGKTSLAYHLAYMFAEQGIKVVAADLDPQANLSSMFLPEEKLEELWPDGEHPRTILGTVKPIMDGTGDVAAPHVEDIGPQLGLIVGDLGLAGFEDRLSRDWPLCFNSDPAAFRSTSAFYRTMLAAASKRHAELVLIDVGPNLGAINRAAIIAADHIVIPLAADLYSLQGLRNLGPTLRTWRKTWQEMLTKNPDENIRLPAGNMVPQGYVILQHSVRADRPVKAYERWIHRIPLEYRRSVLGKSEQRKPPTVENDPHCLASLKHYRSLMPMAMEARKPIFQLKPADGAIGSHAQAVQVCYKDFEGLTRKITQACGL